MYEEKVNKEFLITPADLERLMSAAIKAGREPGVLEASKIDAEVQREKRKQILALELGYTEELRRFNQQNGCSHSRDKSTGLEVSKGQGQWMTAGQVLSDGKIFLLCQRCQTSWTWLGSQQELDYAGNAGLLGFPPPPIDRCLNKADFLRTRPKQPAAFAEAV